ncbi:MAG TPA: DUF3352 domain-containing protein [Vitreimonas sp.]|nr:DUF3352 domain-containing protein [Vitreimonas sp.]
MAWRPPPNGTVEDATPTTTEEVRRDRRRGRLRWGVALLVTALVVAVGALAVLLLTGQSAPSSVAGYAPVNSVAYGELRLDLPGDQKQQLGDFLSRFPGFADRSTLDAKLDDVLDRVIRAVSDDQQDWTTKIKPWFGGQLGFSLGELPDPATAQAGADARGLLILSVTDADRARSWFSEVVADAPSTEATHQDVPITLFGDGQPSGAMAIHEDRMMLVGDEASVRAAIDTGGRSTFSSEGAFAEALGSVEGEGLGFVYFDLERYMAWMEEAMDSMPGASGMPMYMPPAGVMPDWMLIRLRAQDQALAMDTVVPHSDVVTAATENRAGVLAGHAPPSTIALVEGHEAGAMVLRMIDLAKRDPQVAEDMAEFERQIALIGGLNGIIGWWGDAGIAIARGPDGIQGGLLIQPTDRAAADRLLGVIRAGIEFGAGGAGVTVRDESYNGATITIIDLGDLGMLGAIFGAQAGLPPGAELPDGRLEIAMATTEEIVVLAVGPEFVRAVLDAGTGPSLADDARYKDLIEEVGAENVGTMFVDVAAVRGLFETLGTSDPEAFARYERDIKPYLLPIDAFVQATRLDGELDRSVTLITVR